jgi:RNA polymerase sigma-70 factor (ECF subfamily)
MSGNLNGSSKDYKLVEHFLRRNDERAFQKLYRRHAPSLNQLVVRLIGGLEFDAEDVIQATWIRAIERLSTFRWESSFSTWLTGIAINCSREYMRKTRRVQSHELLEAVDNIRVSRINNRISLIDLERAIAILPDGYREVLILHDIEGYTHNEIAGFLEIESGTSKSQLSRARKAIRALLSEEDEYRNDRRSERQPESRRAEGFPFAEGDTTLHR